jgi:hypothetical protein
VDLYPLETMRIKKKFLEKCLNNSWSVAFDHDTELKLAELKKKDEKIEAIKVSFQE